jgi:UTP:GlnB (protein PII) uridylyltransferase
LRAGALVDEEPELTRIARSQERPLVLMLGLLFHDLGKGLGSDHSRRGAEMVRAYAERLELDPTDAADIEWLVLAHLKMSHISQRRDLEDPSLIESFAAEARTLERLEMLYLLTYADSASVSLENWTPSDGPSSFVRGSARARARRPRRRTSSPAPPPSATWVSCVRPTRSGTSSSG